MRALNFSKPILILVLLIGLLATPYVFGGNCKCADLTTNCTAGCSYNPWVGSYLKLIETYEYATCVNGIYGNSCTWDWETTTCRYELYATSGCAGYLLGHFETAEFDADWASDWCWMN